MQNIKKIIKRFLRLKTSPEDSFLSHEYQRHNQRRLEHLASLGLKIAGSSVLEVGAGIGEHTSFFLDRGCKVTAIEARQDNMKILHSRYPDVRLLQMDMNNPQNIFDELFDIIYCYGLLYHLNNPLEAINYMSRYCHKMLLLETCVSFGNEVSLNSCKEDARNPTQAFSGKGCRPTRSWVYNQLKQNFQFVYVPVTQPNHEEFPVNWSVHSSTHPLTRSVFIASKQKLDNKLLKEEILVHQKRSG